MRGKGILLIVVLFQVIFISNVESSYFPLEVYATSYLGQNDINIKANHHPYYPPVSE